MKLFKKAKEALKNFWNNRKGNEIIAVALILIFVILFAAPYIKDLGETTGNGVDSLNTEMEETLSGSGS